MRRPCHCDDVQRCRPCWLFRHDARYRTLWSEGGNSAKFNPAHRCIHLGMVVDRLGCLCQAKWKRHCELHQVTTLDQCASCRDYEAEDPPCAP